MRPEEVVDWLRKAGSQKNRDGMARYAIPSTNAFGVPMATMQALAKKIGRDHKLAADLWKSGWYEARTVAALVDDPKLVTKAQMNAWANAFDSWAICDSVCFMLFDRVPFAYERAAAWSASPKEFVRRAGYALMASLAGHDKAAPDSKFLAFLPLIERAGDDERNFVKKGVSWALRRIGTRSPAMKKAALQVAKRMAKSAEPAARWIGKDALNYFTKARK